MSTEYKLLKFGNVTIEFSEQSNRFSLDITQSTHRESATFNEPQLGVFSSVEIGPMEMEQVSEFLLNGIQAFWYWSTKEQQEKFIQGLMEIRARS
jgi:hypothetical protein